MFKCTFAHLLVWDMFDGKLYKMKMRISNNITFAILCIISFKRWKKCIVLYHNFTILTYCITLKVTGSQLFDIIQLLLALSYKSQPLPSSKHLDLISIHLIFLSSVYLFIVTFLYICQQVNGSDVLLEQHNLISSVKKYFMLFNLAFTNLLRFIIGKNKIRRED